MNSKLSVLLGVVACAALTALLPAAEPIVPDLKQLAEGVGAKIVRPASARWDADVKGRPALFVTGVIWLDGVEFADGTIECDILGKSTPPGSNFLGVAFRGADATTYDCVYFRPFNFRAENPENASHAVQYISAPDWPWQKLRAEKTGQYEKPIASRPNGDAWFHARIVVAGKSVRVFVNDATTPSLEVQTLNERRTGRVGIWGGDAGVGGYFTNLKITPTKK